MYVRRTFVYSLQDLLDIFTIQPDDPFSGLLYFEVRNNIYYFHAAIKHLKSPARLLQAEWLLFCYQVVERVASL